MKRYIRFFVGLEDNAYVACGIVGLNTWTQKGAVSKFSKMIREGTIKSRLPDRFNTSSYYVEGRKPAYDSQEEVPESNLEDLGLIQFS